jgi:hypothetical protein
MHKHSFENLALSSNSQYLITSGDKILKFWDANMELDVNYQVSFHEFSSQFSNVFPLEFYWSFWTSSKSVFHG